MRLLFSAFLVLCCIPGSASLKKNCWKKQEVCVCADGYCDEVEPIGSLSNGQIAVYTTSIDGKRLSRTNSTFQKTTGGQKFDYDIKLDADKTYQSIIGFGAAFTDAAGINLLTLTEDMQKLLLASFFGKTGIELNMARVPIGSCDFSSRVYSYADQENDFDMKTFALADEDFKLKIPFMKIANELTGNKLKFFSGIWSPPWWMKKTEKMVSGGPLKGVVSQSDKYYNAYVKYIIRFFEEYKKQNITFWGLGVQNEPSLGIVDDYWWQELYLSADMEREFIKQLLGPAVRSNPVTKDLKILCMDDQRFELPHRPFEILNDSVANSYVDGIAVHWYENFLFDAKVMSTVHDVHPDKFFIATEACNGYSFLEPGPKPGDWSNGMAYAIDILDDLQNWVTAWNEWNIAVDEQGGPTFAKNYVDASIIVNTTAKEFYKNPSFYVLGQFSKFIRPGSVRIDLNMANFDKKQLDAVAFRTPTNQFVVVLVNRNGEKTYKVRIGNPSQPLTSVNLSLDPNSVTTLIWNA
ncbi:Glucosylceramidase [Aphelenchoides bicaudatus]|nr:Glucosylceramidase [Aphelenchoides bicaudatus]